MSKRFLFATVATTYFLTATPDLNYTSESSSPEPLQAILSKELEDRTIVATRPFADVYLNVYYKDGLNLSCTDFNGKKDWDVITFRNPLGVEFTMIKEQAIPVYNFWKKECQRNMDDLRSPKTHPIKEIPDKIA